MAQKRMIDKKISVSEQVANLDLLGQLLFTWMIPHADDLGLLPYSPKTIKAMVVPMLDIKVEDIVFQMESIWKQDLITPFEYKGEKFWKIKNFSNNQTLKKDRYPQVLLKITFPKEVAHAWELCSRLILEDNGIQLEDNGIQLEDNGIQLDTEVNRIEEKLNEVNRSEVNNTNAPTLQKTKYSLLEEIAAEDMEEIAQHYRVPLAFVKSKYEDMCLWVGEKAGRDKGRNWKLTLMNWVKRDRLKIMERSQGDPAKRATDARDL